MLQVSITSLLVVQLDWLPAAAVLLANLLSLTFHFTMNRHFTFKVQEATQGNVLKYLITAFLNTLIQTLVFVIMYGQFGLNGFLASITASLTTLISGYLLMRSWVFRK